jgi:hypothetical protein
LAHWNKECPHQTINGGSGTFNPQLVISNQTKQTFTQKNRITVQPALNVQSIQVQEDAPEIQLELGELKLILKDPLFHFGRKELTNNTFKDEIISLSKIENHQEVVYLENPNNPQIPKFKGIAESTYPLNPQTSRNWFNTLLESLNPTKRRFCLVMN